VASDSISAGGISSGRSDRRAAALACKVNAALHWRWRCLYALSTPIAAKERFYRALAKDFAAASASPSAATAVPRRAACGANAARRSANKRVICGTRALGAITLNDVSMARRLDIGRRVTAADSASVISKHMVRRQHAARVALAQIWRCSVAAAHHGGAPLQDVVCASQPAYRASRHQTARGCYRLQRCGALLRAAPPLPHCALALRTHQATSRMLLRANATGNGINGISK